MMFLIYFFALLGFDVFCFECMIDWIDIPCTNYKEILASDEDEMDFLNGLVEQYHLLNKSSITTQQDRIHLLDDICTYLQWLSHQEKFKEIQSTILLLNKAVQNKREYIKQILQIPSDEKIASYHLDTSEQQEMVFEPLLLRNNSSYSLKMKEFWGNFWLESIDPCHRRLANYYQFWLNTNPVVKTYQSFFLWLESQTIPKNVLMVDYYSDEQVKIFNIVLIDGYLKKYDTLELVNTDPLLRNVFVIDLAKELYLKSVKEGVWHTSLSRGKPILGAGLLQIEQGVIKMISFESGHYLPSIKQSFQALQILHAKGARFTDPFEVNYFENRNKYKVLLSVNDIKEYAHFIESLREKNKREMLSSNEF